jgi:hypothetical protein
MKVMIDYDTVTKKLVVTEDGNVMPAVDSIHFYVIYPEKDGQFAMEICQSARNEDAGMTKRVITMAKVFGLTDEN